MKKKCDKWTSLTFDPVFSLIYYVLFTINSKTVLKFDEFSLLGCFMECKLDEAYGVQIRVCLCLYLLLTTYIYICIRS